MLELTKKTIGFPYAVMMNGYILGPFLIALGGFLTYYSGMLIVKSSVCFILFFAIFIISLSILVKLNRQFAKLKFY
jgi:hypothetical protein